MTDAARKLDTPTVLSFGLVSTACASTQAHFDLVTLKDQAEFESTCIKNRIEVLNARDVSPNHTLITLGVCGQR